MCSTERNSQGEILDRDILKERKTYVHPSKYFHELIQLDSSREKDDFLNERSIKKVYERQRGKSNSPTRDLSTPFQPPEDSISNLEEPIDAKLEDYNGREGNEITYDDIDGETREQIQGRFEERKHNPGREKTIIEDFVYRYYGNKVNETYNVDRNTRFYTGNDNMEIEFGDRNYRQHRGSHNQHLDIGNKNTTINKGWVHTHIDDGHHMIELNGERPFETSGTHEDETKMTGSEDYKDAQHTDDAANGIGEIVEGIDSFELTDYNETDRGSQFFILHEPVGGGNANQTFRLVKGHQLFYLLEGNQTFLLDKGDQGFHIFEGNQYFLLDEGDQKFELLKGDMLRNVTGKRITEYSDDVTEESATKWDIKAPEITLDGNVTITGNCTVVGASSGPNNNL